MGVSILEAGRVGFVAIVRSGIGFVAIVGSGIGFVAVVAFVDLLAVVAVLLQFAVHAFVPLVAVVFFPLALVIARGCFIRLAPLRKWERPKH